MPQQLADNSRCPARQAVSYREMKRVQREWHVVTFDRSRVPLLDQNKEKWIRIEKKGSTESGLRTVKRQERWMNLRICMVPILNRRQPHQVDSQTYFSCEMPLRIRAALIRTPRGRETPHAREILTWQRYVVHRLTSNLHLERLTGCYSYPLPSLFG